MAQIQIIVIRTGQAVPTKISNISDADLDAIVAAYQNEANSAVGGTATYAQVLNFVVTQWYNQTRQFIQRVNTAPAVIPPPINLS